MQGLLPDEKVLEQVNSSFRQNDGILLVTNVRILWKRMGDSLYTLTENRLNIKSAQKAQDPKTPNRYVLRIEVAGLQKPVLLSFKGNDADVKSDGVLKLLQERPSVEEIKKNSLESDSIFKIYELHQNPHLKELFDELVITKQQMSENEFWETQGKSDNQAKIDSTQIINAGISNRPFLLIPRQNTQTQKSEYQLEPGDCQRLLKEFPDLRASYESKVPLKKKENEFWQEFLDKNFKYKTEIFGGNNPIFIPYSTDEKLYEDRYIHNPKELLKDNANAGDKDKKKFLIDVNYVENVQVNSLPSGYGTYQKYQEIDALNAIYDQVDLDTTQQQKKEVESQIKAKKIINKYNHNSQRIISSNNHQRNLDLKDYEIQLKEKINHHEEQKQQQNTQVAKKSTSFQENDLNNILGNLRNNVHQASLNAKGPIQVDATNYQEIQKKLMKDIKQQIYLLDLNKDPNLIIRKMPPQVYEKMIFYYKKYKVLLRHCYLQFERFHEPEVFQKLVDLINAIKEEARKLDDFINTENIQKYRSLFQPLRSMYDKMNQNFTHMYGKNQAQIKIMQQQLKQQQQQQQNMMNFKRQQ